MSIQADLNKLIDWYDANRPEVMEIAVKCRPATLKKFCRKKRGYDFVTYRGKKIIPIVKPLREEQ